MSPTNLVSSEGASPVYLSDWPHLGLGNRPRSRNWWRFWRVQGRLEMGKLPDVAKLYRTNLLKAFYINLFIGAVCAPAWLFLLPSVDPRPGVPYKQRAKEMDYVGTVLLMGGLTCFILAINWGGATYPWDSGRIIGLFVASGVLFILLGIQQVWTIFTTLDRRIIPVQFFRSPIVLILFSMTAAAGAAAFIPIYFVRIISTSTSQSLKAKILTVIGSPLLPIHAKRRCARRRCTTTASDCRHGCYYPH